MAKTKEREQALRLRAKGKSIKEIARQLKVSQGTVSYWCRDIVLSKHQIAFLKERQKKASIAALLQFAETQRAERKMQTTVQEQKGREDVGTLTKRDQLMIGLGLYWGEGYKKGNEEFGFTNSDPAMIDFVIKVLEQVYKISRDRLILRVSINAIHRERIEVVTKFWSKRLCVLESQFTKPSFIQAPVQKKYRNDKEHFGTIRVKVRGGTNLRRRILGSLKEISECSLNK